MNFNIKLAKYSAKIAVYKKIAKYIDKLIDLEEAKKRPNDLTIAELKELSKKLDDC